MSYLKPVDELAARDMLDELARRRVDQAAGRCDYCHQPRDTASCKFPDRHAGRASKVSPSSLIREDDPAAADLADAAKLLGPARMVLDRCAEDVLGCQAEAADMAQRIVDLIGHSVTDEPPHALVELDRLRRLVAEAGL